MDKSNHQYHVHWNAKLRNYGGWQTWNINIQSSGSCVVALVVVVWCFSPHKCTSLNIFGQVKCRNILKCQLYHIIIVYVIVQKLIDNLNVKSFVVAPRKNGTQRVRYIHKRETPQANPQESYQTHQPLKTLNDTRVRCLYLRLCKKLQNKDRSKIYIGLAILYTLGCGACHVCYE